MKWWKDFRRRHNNPFIVLFFFILGLDVLVDFVKNIFSIAKFVSISETVVDNYGVQYYTDTLFFMSINYNLIVIQLILILGILLLYYRGKK